MNVSESDAQSWYESNGISSDSWDDMPDFQQGMVALESVADSWSEISKMLEVGIPESAVVMYFDINAIGLDVNEVEYRAEENAFESLTSYILQNTTSQNVKMLFNDTDITVLSVGMADGWVSLECEATQGIFS